MSAEDDAGQPLEQPPEREPEHGRPGSGAAILLASAAVVAAVLVARSSFVASAATEAWQQALREEIKRSAALVEDVRFVYTDEAPLAFIAVAGQTLAEEHREAARGATGDARQRLLVEARTHQLLVDTVTPASAIVGGEDYALDGGGYDLGARLADVRGENPDLVALDPAEPQARGDQLSAKAGRLVLASVLAAVAFLAAALAQVFRRGHLALLAAGWVVLGVAAAAGVLAEVVG